MSTNTGVSAGTLGVNDNIELDLVASGLTVNAFDLTVCFDAILTKHLTVQYFALLGAPNSFTG